MARPAPLERRPPRPSAGRPALLLLGVDGGGTKTRAVVTDGDDRILGEGVAGPSNPLRVGVAEAAVAVREAAERACAAAGVRRVELAAAEVGLAGVKRADLRARMREALSGLGPAALEVVTDADIALYGATGGGPGLAVIAGTGSICCGANARGRRACAGGWGPVAGDEGSGSWIARRGLAAVARATDGRGTRTQLVEAACDYFNVTSPEDLSLAIYAPNMTNQRIAGFARHVIEAAQRRDAISRAVLRDAGRELGLAAATVVRKLRMQRERFRVGYVGGVFTAGELILGPLREAVSGVAPHAELCPPELAPAEAAARMARSLGRRDGAQHVRLALAG
ncbi:MAG TPA: BadF/BadG/BcrA/BcrD ATPase family protein [Pyrinomonadaceae bacterium]|nr:BadF/BadG/BcrA/BcrD ATPase family protein [Pyrinomonadaceae bacterium]